MTDFEKEVLEYIRFRKSSLARVDYASIALCVLFGAAVVVSMLELLLDVMS